MRTTIDLPDELFKETKSTAALEGRTLKEFITEAVREKLSRRAQAHGESGWRRVFGAASPEVVAEVDQAVADLEQIDPAEWR